MNCIQSNMIKEQVVIEKVKDGTPVYHRLLGLCITTSDGIERHILVQFSNGGLNYVSPTTPVRIVNAEVHHEPL